MLRSKIRKSKFAGSRNRDPRFFDFSRDDEEKRQILDLEKILLFVCLGLVFVVGALTGVAIKGNTSTAAPQYGTSPLVLMVVGKPNFDGRETTVTHEFKGAPNQLYKIEYTTNLGGQWESGDEHYSTEDGVFYATFNKTGNKSDEWGKQMFFRLKNNI